MARNYLYKFYLILHRAAAAAVNIMVNKVIV